MTSWDQLRWRLASWSGVNAAYTAVRSALTAVSPVLSTRLQFRLSKGQRLDLQHPVTFDEKISWLKLHRYAHDPLVRRCADKYRVREFVRDRGCGHLLNDLLACYDRVEDVVWDDLPEAFVLKWNVGSGGNLVCPDRSRLDVRRATRFLRRAGRRPYHLPRAELHYKNVPRVLMLERLITSEDGCPLRDYKLSCFGGRVESILVCVDRGQCIRFHRFDRNWNRTFGVIGSDADDRSIPRPEALPEMIDCAERLAKGFPYVRVDFYLEGGGPVFGEMTFTPGGGINPEYSPELDRQLGDLLPL